MAVVTPPPPVHLSGLFSTTDLPASFTWQSKAGILGSRHLSSMCYVRGQDPAILDLRVLQALG